MESLGAMMFKDFIKYSIISILLGMFALVVLVPVLQGFNPVFSSILYFLLFLSYVLYLRKGKGSFLPLNMPTTIFPCIFILFGFLWSVTSFWVGMLFLGWCIAMWGFDAEEQAIINKSQFERNYGAKLFIGGLIAAASTGIVLIVQHVF